jgi:2-dehydropantoate 2-reductase
MPEPARVAVIGAGAMGLLLGAQLSTTDAEVTIVTRRAEVVEQLRDGVIVRDRRTSDGQARCYSSLGAVMADDVAGNAFDLVLLVNKSFDSEWALELGLRSLAAEGVLVSIQNGLHTGLLLARADHRCVPGVAYQGATHVEAAVVDWTAQGPVVVAPRRELVPRMTALASSLTSSDLAFVLTDDAEMMLWEKLIGSALNLISGALLMPIGQILASARAREVVDEARRELFGVAAAAGVAVTPERLAERLRGGVHGSSMTGSTYQSLVAGRRSEVAQLLGDVERLSAVTGKPTPVITTLGRLALAREELLDSVSVDYQLEGSGEHR